MPLVTAIESQKKKKGRFNIFLDGKFAFGADENFLAKNYFKIGQKLTHAQVRKYIKEAELSKLFDSSLRFLSYRPRSEKEISQYLAKKIAQKAHIKYQQSRESPQIPLVIKKLKKYKYLNDLEFAKWWASSRVKATPRGQLFIKYELTKKGIEKDIIEKILSNFPNETTLAQRAIEKKLKIWKKLQPKELKNKIYIYLRSKGFSYDTAREVFAFLQGKS